MSGRKFCGLNGRDVRFTNEHALPREEWINRAAARIEKESGMSTAEATGYAQIYLDDVLSGDTSDDPETAADECMGDWS